MNRILITGAHGLLGQKLAICFGRESNCEILLTDLDRTTAFNVPRFDYTQLDITNKSDVKSLIASYKPDVIIHTAAITDVDLCETEREFAWRVNVDGVKNILIAARRLDKCHLIHLSTDYIFDGKQDFYNEESRPFPLNYYGKTKLASENALVMSGVSHSIVRTQLLYGTGINTRNNFVTWALQMLEQKKIFSVVDDQTGNPTFADDLSYAILKIAEQSKNGIYHVCGPEALNRMQFAKYIAQVFQFDGEFVHAGKTRDLQQIAVRPHNSTFVTLKFESEFGFRLADVLQGLQRLRDQYKEGAEFLEHLNEKK